MGDHPLRARAPLPDYVQMALAPPEVGIDVVPDLITDVMFNEDNRMLTILNHTYSMHTNTHTHTTHKQVCSVGRTKMTTYITLNPKP